MIITKPKFYPLIVSTMLTIGIFLPIFPTLATPIANFAKTKPIKINLVGTIHKLAVEGTCYQLAADNGKKYELMGKFPKIEGTRVQIRGVVVMDTATICQVGQLLKVKAVRVINSKK
jgi:hypothetical protein